MALFRRNNKIDVPEEVQQYYTQSRRERTWVAWALAIVTMLVTVLIALGLFYGGRWIYRELTSSDDSTTTQEATGDVDEVPGQGNSGSSSQSGDGQSSGGEPQSQTPSPAPAPTTTPTATQTPAAGPAPDSSLPRTGPAEDL